MDELSQDRSSAPLALQNRGQSGSSLIFVSISSNLSKFFLSKRLSSSLGVLTRMTGFHHLVFYIRTGSSS